LNGLIWVTVPLSANFAAAGPRYGCHGDRRRSAAATAGELAYGQQSGLAQNDAPVNLANAGCGGLGARLAAVRYRRDAYG